MWLTRFAISRPVITAMLFIALAVFGTISFFKLGRSQDPPNTAFPVVVVQANYAGASPDEMTKLIVKPIEDQLDGIDDVDQVTATAQESTASVVVQFNLGTDLNLASINVQRAVDAARVFMPNDLDPPYVFKNGSTQPLLDLAVSSNELSPTQLADVVDNRLKPVLKAIPNVQTVDVFGEQTREFHVYPDPAALIAVNGTLSDIFNAVSQNNSNLPGGLLQQPTREVSVSVHADVNTAADLAGIALPIPGNSNRTLRIGDVAQTDDGHTTQRYISKYDGQPRLYVSLGRTITSDEISATAIARAQLAIIEKQFPQLSFHEIDAPADYTADSLNGVWQSLIEGIILTAIVMMLFLHAWRNAAVVLIAIPSSIFSTFIVMQLFGFHLDMMSLMGLSLIIGILVDDSIVVLENITRHRDMGESAAEATINGRNEIGGAAVAITMVDVVVFLPIAFLPGIVGRYLMEFGAVVVIATLFSLFVSFTLTPLLAATWSVKKREQGLPNWLEPLKDWRLSAALIAAAIGMFFLPWTYGRVIGIILGALVVLNAIVARYDDILGFYHKRALPAALRHGYFVGFVCALLTINAILLIGGGTISAVVDIMVIIVLGLGLLLSPFARALDRRGKLVAVNYTEGMASAPQILLSHIVACVGAFDRVHRNGHRRFIWFAAARNYLKFLLRSSAHMLSNRRVLAATFGVPLALALTMPLLGKIAFDFVPQSQTGAISMTLTYPPGTPIDETSKYADALSTQIMKIPGIESISSTVGRKPSGWGSSVGGNYAVLNAQTTKAQRSNTNAIIEKIRALTSFAPGGDFEVSGDGGGGSGTQIFYALTGPDSQINGAAEKVANYLRAIPGSVNVQTSAENGAPRLNVQIDRAKCAVLGVSPGAAALAARLAIDGAVATKVRTENGLVDVRVEFPRALRADESTLRNVRVRASDGTLVPVGSVATFTWTTAPTRIERLNRQRVVNIYGGTLPGYSLGSVTQPLEAALHQPGFLPPGVQLKAQGDTQYMMETVANMGIALLVSFMLVYMLMVILYGSFVEPLIVMFSVPVAIVGALIGLGIAQLLNHEGAQSLNLISMIGIIMLFGLVAKNGILLVDYSNTLCKRGMRVKEAVLEAAATRFRPIVMTTSAMVFGMLPLALGFAEGAEWRQSMGTVIIGGLLSSLILTLFLVPMIYNTWLGFAQRVADRKAVQAELSPVVANA